MVENCLVYNPKGNWYCAYACKFNTKLESLIHQIRTDYAKSLDINPKTGTLDMEFYENLFLYGLSDKEALGQAKRRLAEDKNRKSIEAAANAATAPAAPIPTQAVRPPSSFSPSSLDLTSPTFGVSPMQPPTSTLHVIPKDGVLANDEGANKNARTSPMTQINGLKEKIVPLTPLVPSLPLDAPKVEHITTPILKKQYVAGLKVDEKKKSRKKADQLEKEDEEMPIATPSSQEKHEPVVPALTVKSLRRGAGKSPDKTNAGKRPESPLLNIEKTPKIQKKQKLVVEAEDEEPNSSPNNQRRNVNAKRVVRCGCGFISYDFKIDVSKLGRDRVRRSGNVRGGQSCAGVHWWSKHKIERLKITVRYPCTTERSGQGFKCR